MKAMSLRIRMATHWPGATPSTASPVAMRRTRASSASGLRRRAPLTSPVDTSAMTALLSFPSQGELSTLRAARPISATSKVQNVTASKTYAAIFTGSSADAWRYRELRQCDRPRHDPRQGRNTLSIREHRPGATVQAATRFRSRGVSPEGRQDLQGRRRARPTPAELGLGHGILAMGMAALHTLEPDSRSLVEAPVLPSGTISL